MLCLRQQFTAKLALSFERNCWFFRRASASISPLFPHPSLSLYLSRVDLEFVRFCPISPACAHHARLHSPFSLGFCPSPTRACCSALNAKVSPTDVEEGMRVGVDRTKYSVQIPLPPKIDPTVRKQERERERERERESETERKEAKYSYEQTFL